MSDQADCCRHPGRVTVGKDTKELVFCGHHYRKHEIRLLMDGWKITSSTDEWSTKSGERS